MPSRSFSLHAQHVDEYVFEARLRFVPGVDGAVAGPYGIFEQGAVRPSDTQGASEHGGRLDTGRAPQPPGFRVQIAVRRFEND
jgi:hypothetical protein